MDVKYGKAKLENGKCFKTIVDFHRHIRDRLANAVVSTGGKNRIDPYALTINNVAVCKEAFRVAWDISMPTWNRIHAEAIKGIDYHRSRLPRALSNKRATFNAWFWNYLLAHVPESQPQNGQLQISPIRVRSMYALYMFEKNQQGPHISAFRRFVRQSLKENNVRIRKRKDCAGKCLTCVEIDDFWRKSMNNPDMREYCARQHWRHVEEFKEERRLYNARRALGEDPHQAEYDSMVTDGAANKNTQCPHMPQQAKGIHEKISGFFSLHLQLTCIHGALMVFCLFWPWVQNKGANAMLTTWWITACAWIDRCANDLIW
jgi:hypothetical protein